MATTAQQRQPGFIEQQIRRQISSAQWQEDFGRLLFQLMVPADFKEVARALDGVVLVFLNCSHLAKVNFVSHDANQLAASLSRELIEAGVRCVIVAGWAADDLLKGGDSFGVAVFKARQAVSGTSRPTTSPGAPSRPMATPPGGPKSAAVTSPTGSGNS